MGVGNTSRHILILGVCRWSSGISGASYGYLRRGSLFWSAILVYTSVVISDMGKKDKNEAEDKTKNKPKDKTQRMLDKARRQLASLRYSARDADIVDFRFLQENPILLTGVDPLDVDFNGIGVITQPTESVMCTVIDDLRVEHWCTKHRSVDGWG